jgi:hypothetical protein
MVRNITIFWIAANVLIMNNTQINNSIIYNYYKQEFQNDDLNKKVKGKANPVTGRGGP